MTFEFAYIYFLYTVVNGILVKLRINRSFDVNLCNNVINERAFEREIHGLYIKLYHLR